MSMGDKSLIIFQAELLVCQLEEGKEYLHVAFVPIFNARVTDGTGETANLIIMQFCEKTISDDSIIFTDVKGEESTIEKTINEHNQTKYIEFKKEYDQHWELTLTLRSELEKAKRNIKRSYIE